MRCFSDRPLWEVLGLIAWNTNTPERKKPSSNAAASEPSPVVHRERVAERFPMCQALSRSAEAGPMPLRASGG